MEPRTPYVRDASRPWQRSMTRANSSVTNSSTSATRFGSNDTTARSRRLLRPLRTPKTGNLEILRAVRNRDEGPKGAANETIISRCFLPQA